MSHTNPRRPRVAAQPAENRREHFLLRAVRAVLMLLIVVASLYVASGYWRMWSQWRRNSQPPTGNPSTAADANAMAAAMLPLAGQWSFGDVDWKLRSQVIERGDVAARLAALAESSHDSPDQLADVSQELIEMARNLGIKPVERSGNQVYLFDRPDLKAQLVVRVVAARPKAIALAAAYPQPSGRWQLLEFTPRDSGSTNEAASHLLPLPGGARRNGGRFADDGRLLLELVALESDAEQLISTWKQNGWEVRPSGLAGPDDFSYLCARGPDVIYAWSADRHDAVRNLMLVHTPSSSDTKYDNR